MNENKFDNKAIDYAKARPAYPRALFDFLSKQNYINSCSVAADIASGTGIFTVQTAELVSKVYAVEPNADMRREAEHVYFNYPNIISVNATAEHTKLKEHSIDCVTAAQAFHWFDREMFKKECQRILKPDGAVILVWNNRDENSDIIKANYAVNRKYCPNFKGASNGIDFNSIDGFFTREFESVEFDNSLIYDRETFISRSLSSSYAPKQHDGNYCAYVRELESVFDRISKNGMIEYPYITTCYIGTV